MFLPVESMTDHESLPMCVYTDTTLQYIPKSVFQKNEEKRKKRDNSHLQKVSDMDLRDV